MSVQLQSYLECQLIYISESSVSLSALKNTTVLPNATSQDQGVDIRILSHVPLSINFTTLEYAYEINLNGSIAA